MGHPHQVNIFHLLNAAIKSAANASPPLVSAHPSEPATDLNEKSNPGHIRHMGLTISPQIHQVNISHLMNAVNTSTRSWNAAGPETDLKEKSTPSHIRHMGLTISPLIHQVNISHLMNAMSVRAP